MMAEVRTRIEFIGFLFVSNRTVTNSQGNKSISSRKQLRLIFFASKVARASVLTGDHNAFSARSVQS